MPRRNLASLVAAAALSVAACAHAPAVPVSERRPEEGTMRRVLVTGSRIPQPVNARTGVPITTSPLAIYGSMDLVHTGRPGDLVHALTRLDPAFGVRP